MYGYNDDQGAVGAITDRATGNLADGPDTLIFAWSYTTEFPERRTEDTVEMSSLRAQSLPMSSTTASE